MVRLCPNLLLIWILLWYKQDAEIVEWFSISGRMAEDRCLPAVINIGHLGHPAVVVFH